MDLIQDYIEKGYRWAAMDYNGRIFLYMNEPFKPRNCDVWCGFDNRPPVEVTHLFEYLPKITVDDSKPKRLKCDVCKTGLSFRSYLKDLTIRGRKFKFCPACGDKI